MEIREILQEFLREDALPAEILDILRRETHVLDVLDHLLQPREDGETALIRIRAVKDIERRQRLLIATEEIAIGHGHLVEIHHHRDVARIKLCLCHQVFPLYQLSKMPHNAFIILPAIGKEKGTGMTAFCSVCTIRPLLRPLKLKQKQPPAHSCTGRLLWDMRRQLLLLFNRG